MTINIEAASNCEDGELDERADEMSRLSASPLVSINNGLALVDASELTDSDLAQHWDALTAAMEVSERDWVHDEFAPCSQREFLRHYLAAAQQNLVVG